VPRLRRSDHDGHSNPALPGWAWSFYIFRSCELAGGRHFCRIWIDEPLKLCQPRTLEVAEKVSAWTASFPQGLLKPHSFQSNYGRAEAHPLQRIRVFPQPLQSGEAGFQTRVNAPVYRFRALALVAGRPIPFPEMPMTTQTAPVSRSSPL
jgi:hypothetical protein